MNLIFIFKLCALTTAITVLFYSCGCSSYNDEYEYLPNHYDFITEYDEISFRNGDGATATLSVGEVNCGIGEPEDFCEPQCTRTSYEICGQGAAKTLDEVFVLDYSHSKKAWHEENFYFSDCYYKSDQSSTIEIIDSLEVEAKMYYTVWKILPTPQSENASINEFYYVDQIGPIRYLLASGEIWNRIP